MNPIIAFIAETLGGSWTENKVDEKLQQSGVNNFASFILSSLGVGSLLLAGKKIIEMWQESKKVDLSKPIDVLLPCSASSNDTGWYKFENGDDFSNWFDCQSEKYQSTIVAFVAEKIENDDAYIVQA